MIKLISLVLVVLMAGCATTQKHTKAYDEYMSKIDSALASKQITELQASQMRYEAEQIENQHQSESKRSFGQALAAGLMAGGNSMQNTASSMGTSSQNWQQQNQMNQMQNDIRQIKSKQEWGY